MTTARPTLFTRPDTFFGVCQGIGEDLGIHPNLFRVSFGMAFFFAPLVTLATYFALGLVVAATRYAFPVPTPSVTTETAVVEASETVVEQEELPLAA